MIGPVGHMKHKIFLSLALVGGALLLRNLAGTAHAGPADTNRPAFKPPICWKKGPAFYRDRNHDGKIDLEISGAKELAEGADIYKVDTNYDGYYDVEYLYGIPITGKAEIVWTKNIHERVPAVEKDFVPIEKPPWVE